MPALVRGEIQSTPANPDWNDFAGKARNSGSCFQLGDGLPPLNRRFEPERLIHLDDDQIVRFVAHMRYFKPRHRGTSVRNLSVTVAADTKATDH